MINLEEYRSIEAQQRALNENLINVTYFDSFGVEYVPKEIKIFIETLNKYLQNTTLWLNYVWLLLHWVTFDFMFKGKSLTNLKNSLKNLKIMIRYLKLFFKLKLR